MNQNLSKQFFINYLKKQVKKRDDYTCVKCGFEGKMTTIKNGQLVKVPCDDLVEADHIIAKGLNGRENKLEYFQTLCKLCHRKKTIEDIKKIKEMKQYGAL